MRNFPQRKRAALFASLLGTIVGASSGYMLGRVLTLNQTEFRLAHGAASFTDVEATSIRESRSVLSQLNSSPYAFCSDAEIGYFRGLIFQSEFLKDAGRIRDGRVQCSTSLGRDIAQQEQLHPDFTQRDGAMIYRNLPMLRIGEHKTITVQLGDSYVTYNPFSFSPLPLPHMHYTVTEVDAATLAGGSLLGETPLVQGQALTTDGQGEVDGSMYATRCSTVGTICITAYMSVPDALDAARPALVVFALLGGLAGGLLGCLGAFLYQRKKSVSSQLLRSIRRDALKVIYQPIVDLATGRIVEAEALVRWTDEEGKPVSPDVFIKVAEVSGFVGQITKLVVRHVLRDFATTMRERPDFRVNVNIAASDLADPTFLPMLESALQQAGVRPDSLAIEITESYTARQQIAKETILRLRERGHYVYIDDFGTGYSSLAYLHDLAVDAIKIDKAFTRAIGTDAVTVSILPQILTMASKLNLRVIVEGIETPQQARYFAAVNQSIRAQGWLFGHPVPADNFHQQLAGNDVKSLFADPIPSKSSGPSIVHVA
jgi:sensor c-di-GMP phosphodiesterase-like protein